MALQRGLEWLARNQGRDGNWDSNDLGLVGMGALAYPSAGHLPGRGPYGEVVQRALDHEVGVYDDSLIAWTADPDLPMATGTAPR